MKEKGESKLLKKTKFIRTLNRSKEIGAKIGEILKVHAFEAGGKEKIDKLFETELGDLEYFVLMDQTGLSVNHTNRMREGVVFDDSVAQNSIQSGEALLQLYHRNTGELVVDASAPVLINGTRAYTVRAGEAIIVKRLLLVSLLTHVAPVGVAALALLLVPQLFPAGRGIWQSSLTAGVLGIVGALVGAVFSYRIQKSRLDEVRENMQVIARGDLTHTQSVKRQDELGQLVLEGNKVAVGLRNLLSDFAQITEQVNQVAHQQEEATDELSKGTESIAATIEQVTAGSQEQAAAVQHVAEFIGEMSESIETMRQSINRTLHSSQEGVEKMKLGSSQVNASMVQMRKISDTFSAAEQVIVELSNQSVKIGDIISTITGIAEQTNLLALNAAIEAARAGENGRGFAVVAEEVRKLAENSSQAAREIMEIVSETQEQTNVAVTVIVQDGSREIKKGSQLLQETGAAIDTVVVLLEDTAAQMLHNDQLAGKLMETGQLLEEDTERVNEISQGTSLAMQDISATIQQQTVMTEQVANTAGSLAKVANKLQRLITRFKLE